MKRTRLTHVKGATVEREFVHCDQCDRELGMYEFGESPIEPHLCNTEICKMKTETPPTPPTITELWDKLKAALDTNLEARLTADTTDNGKHGTPPSLSIAISETKIKALRQQLLERCTTHDFNWLEPQSKSSVVPDQWIAYHKDNAAYHAFWAWELEQRQREKETKNA